MHLEGEKHRLEQDIFPYVVRWRTDLQPLSHINLKNVFENANAPIAAHPPSLRQAKTFTAALPWRQHLIGGQRCTEYCHRRRFLNT